LYKLTGSLIKQPIFDVQLASRIVRTYTGDYGMEQMIKNLFGVNEDILQKSLLKKGKEFAEDPTKWSPELHQYNVNDVAYLKILADKLKELAKRVGRDHLLDAANSVMPAKGLLHAEGFYRDIFSFTYNDTDMTSGIVIPRR
jgi:ribonuclease D